MIFIYSLKNWAELITPASSKISATVSISASAGMLTSAVPSVRLTARRSLAPIIMYWASTTDTNTIMTSQTILKRQPFFLDFFFLRFFSAFTWAFSLLISSWVLVREFCSLASATGFFLCSYASLSLKLFSTSPSSKGSAESL